MKGDNVKMTRKGYTGRSREHSLNAKHITTVAESEKAHEYTKRYKYKILQNFREELEKVKTQLERQGFKVEITRDKASGIIMTINEHEVQIYPNITIGSIGYIAADVKLPLPETPGLQDLYINVINREVYKRGLMGYTKEWKKDYVVFTIESKNARGSSDSIDEVKKIVNTIRSIEELKRR
jgi:hypothetical protein